MPIRSSTEKIAAEPAYVWHGAGSAIPGAPQSALFEGGCRAAGYVGFSPPFVRLAQHSFAGFRYALLRSATRNSEFVYGSGSGP